MWHSSRITAYVTVIVFNFLLLITAYAADDQGHEVDELAYGVALYDFFQGKYFSAITDILVAEKNQTIVDENKKSELLLGGLYLSYGMKSQAHEIFKKITTETRKNLNGSKNIMDQVWFYMGKDYYADGFEEKAKKALLNISNQSTLDVEYASERLNILAEIYLHNHQLEDVNTILELFPEGSVWKHFAQFNLGLALIKSNRSVDGLIFLENIAELNSSDKELDMLHDQANLVLAVNYLQSGMPDLSVKYFENIKLESTQSRGALLGLGWVKYQNSSYREAINIWLELTSRSSSDLNALEALIFIPQALERRGEKDRALSQYDYAIMAYMEQLKNVARVRYLINQGELISVFKTSAWDEGYLDTDEMVEIIGPELSDYLFELIISNDFRVTVNRYRELAVLRNNLSRWLSAMPSLNLILDEKINTYNERLSSVISVLELDYAKKLHKKREEFVDKLERSLASNEVTMLINKQENKLFNILGKVKLGLDEVEVNNKEVTDIKDKYRFLSGLMEWNISTDYAPRLWAVKKSIAELDNALQGVNRTIQSLTSVRKSAPVRHQQLRNKIKGKKEQIKLLMSNVDQLMSVQERKIHDLAEAAIDQYRAIIKQYHDRALFGRASLYNSLVQKD
ncbi:MAG: hypothetical protein OEY66_03055 [Gammaproteobacteria bacterium]|nr:hypothetical protein [Gammaproteobacteria bacterium]